MFKLLFSMLILSCGFGLHAQVTLTLCPSGCTFNSFANMAANLNSHMAPGGIIINVSPGTYTERFSIGNVGATAANPVIIQSATGDSSDVLITFPSSSSPLDNHLVRFNGASYVTLRNVTLTRTGNLQYNTYVHLTGGSNNCKIESVRFTGMAVNSGNVFRSGMIYSSNLGGGGTAISNMEINRCGFFNHPIGIYIEGISYIIHSGFTITECRFEDIIEPVELKYMHNVAIANSIFINQGLNLGAAIDISNTTGTSNITGNYINGRFSTGIHILHCDGNGQASMISNNEVTLSSSWPDRGIYIAASSYKRVEHNSVWIRSNGSATEVIGYNDSNIVVRNNILTNTGNGLAYKVSQPGADFISDYNLIWANGTNLASYNSTNSAKANGIVGWRSLSGQDANSVFDDPLFYSTDTLIGDAVSIANGGTPIPYITTDRVGNNRSTTAPYLGAHENLSGTPCAFFSLDSVRVRNATCYGSSNGQISLYAKPGSLPVAYSIGLSDTTTVILPKETFSQYQVFASTPSAHNFATCPGANAASFVYGSSGGCTGGNAYLNGNGYGFVGCALQTPIVNVRNYNSVKLKFDVTHPNRSAYGDSIIISIRSNSQFQNQSMVPVTINGVPRRTIAMDQARSCVTMEVEFDISNPNIPSREHIILSIAGLCPGPNCNGFSLRIDNVEIVKGSLAGYVYSYSNFFYNVPAGTYTVMLKGSDGCAVPYAHNPVVVGSFDSIAANLSVSQVTIPAGADGKVWATPMGGMPPYNYTWSGGTATGTNRDTIVGLSAGIYRVTITDQAGCSNTAQITVTAPSCALAITNVGIARMTCHNANDASIIINTMGGYGTVEYSIDNGTTWGTSNVFANLAAGSYSVQVRDAWACTTTGSGNPYNIINPPQLSLTATASDVTVPGGNNGSVILSLTGGVAGYTYQWSNNASTAHLFNIPGGTYCVTITDAAGCTISACATVAEPVCNLFIPQLYYGQRGCNDDYDGFMVIYTTGGSGNIQYSIDNGATWGNDSSYQGLPAGMYNVVVRDALGCIFYSLTNPNVIVPTRVMSIDLVTSNPSGSGVADGAIDATTTGGHGPVTYIWSNSSTTEDISNITNGIYCVTATDVTGCSATACDTLTAACNLSIAAVGIQGVSCYGGSDGAIAVTSIGGQAPVQYSIDNGSLWKNIGTFNNLTPGVYTIKAKDGTGCEVFYANNPVIIDTVAALNPVIIEQNGVLSVSGNYSMYVWFEDGQVVPDPFSTITPTRSASYFVIVEANGCIDTSAIYQFIYTGISDAYTRGLKIWPIPATNMLYYQLEIPFEEDATIELLSITGQQILAKPVGNGSGNFTLSTLAKGIYYFRLTGLSGNLYRKIVVQ